jgi:hypothetical protein
MRTVICVALLCALTAFSVAQEKPNSQDKQDDQDYAAYEATFRLGRELFYKQDGAFVRTAAILRACHQDGLAKAVEAKTDPHFTNELTKMIDEGRFRDLPFHTVLSVQNIAQGIRLGYAIGYGEATMLGLGFARRKNDLCGAAVKDANEILKK